MRQMMENYGEALISGVISTMLIFLIAASGMFSMIGAKLEAPQENYREYHEYKKLQELCIREKPKIRYKQERSWKAGERIPVREIFEAVDSEGNQILVKVKDVKGENGESMMAQYRKEQHDICFLQGGIYIFELQAQDSQKKRAKERIAFSVDNRQVGE